jgi:hypothetical protein
LKPYVKLAIPVVYGVKMSCRTICNTVQKSWLKSFTMDLF